MQLVNFYNKILVINLNFFNEIPYFLFIIKVFLPQYLSFVKGIGYFFIKEFNFTNYFGPFNFLFLLNIVCSR